MADLVNRLPIAGHFDRNDNRFGHDGNDLVFPLENVGIARRLEAVNAVGVDDLEAAFAFSIPDAVSVHVPDPEDNPLSAMRSQYSRFRPTRRATVSRIWTTVPDSR